MRPRRRLLLCCTPLAAILLAAAPTTSPTSPPAAALAWVRTTYAPQYANKSGHPALAQLLLAKGRAESADPDRRAAFLHESLALATDIGDVPTSLAAFAERHPDATPTARLDLLTRLSPRVTTTSNARAFLDATLATADAAAEKDDFPTATRALTLAEKLATLAKDPARQATLKSRADEIAAYSKDAAALRAAESKLRESPTDPAACLQLGRHRCLVRLDWAAGLPLLDHCRDPDFELAAAREKSLRSAQDYLDAAQAWWKIADREIGPAQVVARARAARYYELGFPAVTPDDRPKLDTRLLALLTSTGLRAYADDPAAQSLLLGPDRATLAAGLTFTKFAVRNESDALKNKNVSCALHLTSTAEIPVPVKDRLHYRLRVLCLDADNQPRVLQVEKSFLLKLKPGAPLHFQGPSYEDVKKYNNNRPLPRNAHVTLLLDTTPLWQSLWQLPEKSCWWLDDNLLVAK